MSDSLGQLFTQQPPVLFRVAQLVGITGSAFVFGQNAFLSYGACPTIMEAPAPLAARQWVKMYNSAHIVGPITAIASGLSAAYVAYNQAPESLAFKLNVAAAVLLPSIVPFTYAFIVPTNKKLFAKADSLAATSLDNKAAEAGVAKEETVHALIDKWATLNFARALIVGAAALLAAWAAADKREVVGFREIALDVGANRLGN
ncbi:hypothetical protein BU24DRAFT_416169 [Aaosphaeria arxii CBS 175.79]|uniref:DUF1772-domain-containing protein n=1 Tax=Aaosphaeria arxii CBS 175.79 TaxID=1450172 RepID=A0A6A5Y630_9PLEO|nr:uncharacterized protein BU24DRAFT_416169 [Aaosphaeria arxii CBS 175.79]KAF2020487.1 hypothetical protein BU24DRAFT_416169 [Aaosphaeria arxii CBS 175.79]